MDYQTKPTSRSDLRQYAKILRQIFDVPEGGPFPVLTALEQLRDKFKGSWFEVVENNELPLSTPARCFQNNDGGYTIQIKEMVYKGAHDQQTGAFLGHICHEICHVFLFTIGFTPIHDRSFEDQELPRYCSVEWQCKALAGEVMIPYEESRGMDEAEIISTYHVSKGFAKKRVKM